MKNLELMLWKELAGRSLSVSHDRWHLDRVLAFARQLQQLYGGDMEVLSAAVIMHDLGRSDPDRQHGLASIRASEEGAETILRSIGFPTEKRAAVLEAIASHDQPDFRPTSIEARILKDADFLAGFGAWGILRIAMWSGETGRNTDAVIQRLEAGMPRRASGMEFPASYALARRELNLARVFLTQLNSPPPQLADPPIGRYIVLEGISGSGKNTQAALLQSHLVEAGGDALVVEEPASPFRDYKSAYEAYTRHKLESPEVKKWLLLAAREELARSVVEPALRNGTTVISVRNFVSTLVYQCESDEAVADAAYLHRTLPQPDLVILFDVPAEEARRRIDSRGKAEGQYEKVDDSEYYREKYLAVCRRYFARELRIVASRASVNDVFADVLSIAEADSTPTAAGQLS